LRWLEPVLSGRKVTHVRDPNRPPARGPQHRMLSGWAHRALRLYPHAWRSRYGDEVASVLDDSQVTLGTVLDLVASALDAHGHLIMRAGRSASVVQRIRSSELTIFVAFVLFSLAWLPLHFVSDTPATWYTATLAHPALVVALWALNLAGLLSLLAVLIGGLSLVLAGLRRALVRRRWGLAALFAIPVVVTPAFVAAALLLAPAAHVSLGGGPPTPLTASAVDVRLGLSLGGMLAFALSVAALAIALTHSELSVNVVRLVFIAAGIATAAIAVGMLAGMSLIALVLFEAQELGAWPPLEGLMMLLLVCAAALAGGAFWRGSHALRTSQGQ
jgi:hypothetical protein